jgi:hypothetical protein
MPYTGSQAQAGRGTTLSIGTGAGTLIGEIADLPFARPQWDFANVTNLESGSDEEMLPVIRKAAQFTIKGNRVDSDAGQVLVESAYQAATLSTFTLLLPKTATQTTSGDKYVFSGYVIRSNFSVSPTKQVEFEIEIQSSGAVVFTVGS